MPAFVPWIAYKLQRDASQHGLAAFAVSVETWRCRALQAIHGAVPVWERTSGEHGSDGFMAASLQGLASPQNPLRINPRQRQKRQVDQIREPDLRAGL